MCRCKSLTCYIPTVIYANNCYIIESYSITRPGLEQPYEDGSKLTEVITIRVADWEENEPIVESL